MSLREEDTTKIWISQLRRGNRLAFRKLYEQYHADIYAYGLSLLKNKFMAEDLVQEVFLKVWSKRTELNPDLSFRSFIFTITRNSAFNTLVKAANHTKLREAVFYENLKKNNEIEHKLMDEYYEKLKTHAILELTPRCKLVFEMSRNDGKSYQEISEELGVSVHTVRNQMNMALTTIRNFLIKNGVHTLLFLLLG